MSDQGKTLTTSSSSKQALLLSARCFNEILNGSDRETIGLAVASILGFYLSKYSVEDRGTLCWRLDEAALELAALYEAGKHKGGPRRADA